jgi:hypothetical protein
VNSVAFDTPWSLLVQPLLSQSVVPCQVEEQVDFACEC